MKCRKWLMSCSNCATYWWYFNKNFCYFKLFSNHKTFNAEYAQLQIPASATAYDGSLHLHVNLLINTHYHNWAKPADNSQAVFKQILETMSEIFSEVKNVQQNNLLKIIL